MSICLTRLREEANVFKSAVQVQRVSFKPSADGVSHRPNHTRLISEYQWWVLEMSH